MPAQLSSTFNHSSGHAPRATCLSVHARTCLFECFLCFFLVVIFERYLLTHDSGFEGASVSSVYNATMCGADISACSVDAYACGGEASVCGGDAPACRGDVQRRHKPTF